MARNPNEPSRRPPQPEDWSEDRLAALIRTGGRGEEADTGAQERVRKAVRAEWRSAVKSRSLKRWNLRLGVAVAALVGMAIGLYLFRAHSVEVPPAAEVARVVHLQGALKVAQGDATRPVASGEALNAGTTVQTDADGRAALRLASGVSLRLDCATRIVLDSDRVLRLEKGAVYVDTDGKGGAAGIEVRTPSGVVRDMGTQFEARLVEDRVRLRVREGRVALKRAADTQTADAGQEIVAAAAGEVTRASVSLTDASWNWALACAPAFDVEGKTLAQFLAWAEREGGWKVQFVDSGCERAASGTLLHGSLNGFTPRETLDVVLPTCGLKPRIENGMLWIERETEVVVKAMPAAPVAAASSPGVVSFVKVLSDKVPDVSNVEVWKKAFIKDGMSDQEKALAIWKTVGTFQHQDVPPAEFLTHEDIVYDPIKVFNVYGYAMCGNACAHVTSLARYLGYTARGWGMNHHSICEIQYGNAWHHVDSSLLCYFLKPDGSIAGVEDCLAAVGEWYKKNPDCFDGKHGIDAKLRAFERTENRTAWKTKGPALIATAPTYDQRGWWPAGTHGWYSTMEVFDGSAGDSKPFIYEYGASMGYQVNIQLRKGERLTRNWFNKGLHVNMDHAGPPGCLKDEAGFLKKYDASLFGSLAPGRVGNGTYEYDVPLAGGAFVTGALQVDNLAWGAAGPAVQVKDPARSGVLTFRMPSSYVYLGGEMTAKLTIGDGGAVTASFSDNNGLDWREIAKFEKSGEQKVDLKPFVLRRYDYRVRFELKGKGTGLDALRFVHDIQHSQRPLPAFDQGENKIAFSTGPDEGTITIEANTNLDHKGRQVLYTDFKPEVKGFAKPAPLLMGGPTATLTIPIETPNDMVRLRFGGYYRTWSDGDCWEFSVSFDDGRTFKKVGDGPGQQFGRNAFVAVNEIPIGTRKALVRYTGIQKGTNQLGQFRIDVDYREPHGGFAPVKITYVWEENGKEKRDVHVASKPEEAYSIRCESKPLMKTIVLERE
jgi:ferric-dicitrate binding protein FerR (iron transport regulator)